MNPLLASAPLKGHSTIIIIRIIILQATIYSVAIVPQQHLLGGKTSCSTLNLLSVNILMTLPMLATDASFTGKDEQGA